MIRLVDYIKQCLENPEFRKYWEEDFGTTILEDLHDLWETLDNIYYEELYENQQEYKKDLDNLIKNKGIPVENQTIKNEIILFTTSKDECPVIDFINSITNEKLKEKTVKNIYNLQLFGGTAREPLSKHVGDGIFELRTQQGNNIDRIFYFFVVGSKIVLTNGYIKKDQKLDKLELQKAKNYRDQFFNGYKNEKSKT